MLIKATPLLCVLLGTSDPKNRSPNGDVFWTQRQVILLVLFGTQWFGHKEHSPELCDLGEAD